MSQGFSKLTRPAMRKLTAGDKPITEHGIIFERLENGDGLFTVNIMADGQRIHRTVGRESDGTTRTQAEEFIAKVKMDAKTGRLSLPKGRKVGLSFEDASAKYLTKLEESGGNDIAKKRSRLRLHLVPFFGNTPLSKISGFDLERYKMVRTEASASPGSIDLELAVLSHLFTKAEEWGWIDRRPAKIKKMNQNKVRITYLTVDQIARLIDCAKQDRSAQIYPFIFIGLETSMRLMEILRLRREDIDIERRVINIQRAKAGPREQPFTEGLAVFMKGYLATLPPGNEWLFPSSASMAGHTIDIRDPFQRVVEAAGLDSKLVVPHTLRHTAITHLVQAGVDLPTVQRISGHKTLQMVTRYAHQNGEHISQAMDKLEQRYRKAV